MTARLSEGVFTIVALFCVTIGLQPPYVAAMQSPASFTDMSGRSVHIATPPRSIAVLAPVLSAYSAVAASLSSVKAVSKFVLRTENNGAFRLVFPQLATLPVLSLTGAIPDPELVLEFNPHAVLAWQAQSDALRATGYPGLIELNWNGKQDGSEHLWDFLGKVQNQEGRTTQLWQQAKAQQRALRMLLPHQQKPIRMLVMSPYNSASTWIGRRGYFLNPLVQNLDAVSLTGNLDRGGVVGPEQILRYDPDVILVPSPSDNDDLSCIYGNPLWRALRAVRDKRVYLMPHTSMFNMPVEETALLFWLAEILYPTLPHMTRDAYRSIYADVYGRNLSDAEIDAILHLKKNVGAFGYERFRAASSN